MFFAAYLVGYLFWLGIALGSMGLTMLHHLVGGSWGLVIRRPLEAGAATVPLFALLFLPIAFGMPALYPWARADAAERISASSQGRLLERTVVPGAGSRLFRRLDRARVLARRVVEPAGPHERPSAEPATAAIERAGHRDSVCGGHIFGDRLGDVARGSVGFDDLRRDVDHRRGDGDVCRDDRRGGILARARPMSEIATPERLNDLGNLLLAFVMLWAYMSFCQYLIVWSGNLTEEIPWYLKQDARRLGVGGARLDRLPVLPAVLPALGSRKQAAFPVNAGRVSADPGHALGRPGLAGDPGFIRRGEPADSLDRDSR